MTHLQISQAIADRQATITHSILTQLEESGLDAGSFNWMTELTGELVSTLSQALAVRDIRLLVRQVTWQESMMSAHGIASDLHLRKVMDITKETILDRLPDEADRTVREFVDAAMVEMEQQAGTPSSHVSSALPHGDLAKHYLDALLTGSRQQATSMILEAAESGTSIADIYMHVFQPVQYEIGRLWQINRINVAQEHYCTAVTQAVMSQLYPRLFAGDRTGRTLVATCVAGELHEIGVRMVADFFEMAGWDTYYLGASTPPSDIVRALVDRNADLLAISSTMTWHVRAVRELIDATRESDAHGIRILVGGHPFNTSSELWRKFGADGYAADAKSAVALADQLLRNGAN